MRHRERFFPVLLASLTCAIAAAACGGDDSGGAPSDAGGASDATSGADAAGHDGSAIEAGVDAGARESGVSDAGVDAASPPDAGTDAEPPVDATIDGASPADAASTDANGTDANDIDANASDANAGDANVQDANVPDATDGSIASSPARYILFASATGNTVNVTSEDLSAMTFGFETPYQDVASSAIGLASVGDGTAVLVIRDDAMGELRYAHWNGAWSPGFNTPMLPVQPGLVIAGGPSIAGSSSRAHVAYQGTDTHFYYAEESTGSWAPTNEAITSAGSPSTGPVPPAIATLADVPIIAFIGSDGDLYDQSRVGGAWQAAASHGVANQGASITPAIVSLTTGAELLVVYTDSAAHGLMFTVRTAGAWSAPTPIAGTASNDRISLAPLAAGGAVLSYRGTDQHLYTTILSATAPYTWSAPVIGVMGADPLLQSSPSVATGGIGAEAELLYLDATSFILYSVRMNNGAWGVPVASFGSATYSIAVATGN
jgi:hypothetical protein